MEINQTFRKLIPPLSQEEFDQLEANILAEGCRDPLVLWQGKDVLVDGHNRYEICTRNNLPFNTKDLHFDDEGAVKEWIIKNQLGRRNLTDQWRRYLRGLQYEREKEKRGGDRRSEPQSKGQNDLLNTTNKVAKQIAKEHKVSEKTVRRDAEYMQAIETVAENTSQELKDKILEGQINITQKEVKKLATFNPERQQEVAAKLLAGEVPYKAMYHTEKKVQRQEKAILGLPEGSFNVLYADPPWQYNNNNLAYSAQRQYPTMKTEDIAAMKIQSITAPTAVIFLWVTNPLLKDGLQVLEAWGFTYKTNFCWPKETKVPGFYITGQHELLLIGVKGSFLPWGTKPSSILEGTAAVHSQKPIETYDVIEAMYPDAEYLELFARNQEREGWVKWGNELGKL